MGRKKNYQNTTCLVCGNVFYRRTHGGQSIPKYCSQICYRKSGSCGGFKKGHTTNIGRKRTIEARKKTSLALIGHKIFNPEKSSIGWFKKGNTPHNKGNSTPSKSRQLRNNGEYRHWVKKVILRDKKCVFCGSVNRLEADHIEPLSKHPEKSYDVQNGRTLCRNCHKQTETYGGKLHV